MEKKCNLNSSSRFLDIGAGIGKPNFHAAFAIDVRLSIGLEIMDIRYQVLLSLWAVIILSLIILPQLFNYLF